MGTTAVSWERGRNQARHRRRRRVTSGRDRNVPRHDSVPTLPFDDGFDLLTVEGRGRACSPTAPCATPSRGAMSSASCGPAGSAERPYNARSGASGRRRSRSRPAEDWRPNAQYVLSREQASSADRSARNARLRSNAPLRPNVRSSPNRACRAPLDDAWDQATRARSSARSGPGVGGWSTRASISMTRASTPGRLNSSAGIVRHDSSSVVGPGQGVAGVLVEGLEVLRAGEGVVHGRPLPPADGDVAGGHRPRPRARTAGRRRPRGSSRRSRRSGRRGGRSPGAPRRAGPGCVLAGAGARRRCSRPGSAPTWAAIPAFSSSLMFLATGPVSSPSSLTSR